MAPVKVKDLVTTLSNQKVVDSISAAIQPMIELVIAKALNKRFAELTTVVDNLWPDITGRNAKILTLENQNVKLCAAVD